MSVQPSENRGQIVVGIDQSATCERALTWACRQADRSGDALHLVHVHNLAALYGTFDSAYGDLDVDLLQRVADETVAEALVKARAEVGHSRVTASAVIGSPAAVLVEYSTNATLLVLGSHGHGALSGVLLGSVSTQVAAHAHCPVVVLRELPDGRTDHVQDAGAGHGRIVVGLDDRSAGSDAALEFAFEQASLLAVPLEVVHTWQVVRGPVWAVAEEPQVVEHEVAASSQRLLDEVVSPWAEKHPQVQVRRTSVRGAATTELLRLSVGAELLVVGSRGRGGFAGLLLGSVSHGLLQRATCPVAVVRPRR